MSVTFDEEKTYTRPTQVPGLSGLTGLAVRWGLIKNEKAAVPFFIGIVVVSVSIILFVILQSVRAPNVTTPEDIQKDALNQDRFYGR